MSDLVSAATQARSCARAPYSNFLVGAAVRTATGEIFSGCNVENASYGLTCCAERVALFGAIAAGFSEFEALCVVTNTAEPTPPCGACRQVILELCGDIPITLANLDGREQTISMAELLPHAFDASQLS